MLLPKWGGFRFLPPRDFSQLLRVTPTDHDSNLSEHAEQLDALANKDFQYLTKTYLPRKLKEKDWMD